MKSSLLKALVLCIVLSIGIPAAQANHLRITGITPNQAAGTVTFGLRWQNSWRTNLPPFNWDAVWLFVKFRECGVDPNVPWTHGQINFGSCVFPVALESTTRTGTPGIDPDNLGVMVRRTGIGRFSDAVANTVTLALSNMLPDGTEMDIKVFGIEMVFIPQGPFFIGDGVSNTTYAQFFPIQRIDAASGMTVTNSGSGAVAVTVPATFPNGFNAFYIMKYEISHGQYAAFMNTIPASAVSARNVRTTGGTTNRHVLIDDGVEPNRFYTNHLDRALNFLGWADLAAYLDWAALRPFTELEYEKACRGALAPITREYAWGNTSVVRGATFNLTATPEDGTERFLEADANATVGPSVNYAGGTGGQGPVRVGIHARTNVAVANRVLSGATYYGVLDMTGNVWEYTIVLSEPSILEFNGELGNGDIAADGEHDVAGWPVHNVASGLNVSRVGIRGGSWGTTIADDLSISGRQFMRNGSNGRTDGRGGRGAR